MRDLSGGLLAGRRPPGRACEPTGWPLDQARPGPACKSWVGDAGDTREGTGASVVAAGTTQEQAADSVRTLLAETRATAQELLDQHAG